MQGRLVGSLVVVDTELFMCGLQAIIEAMSSIDVPSLKNVNQGRDALAKVRLLSLQPGC